jgi:hypothetical protein
MNVTNKIIEIFKAKDFENKQFKINSFWFSSSHVGSILNLIKKEKFLIELDKDKKCLKFSYVTKLGKGEIFLNSMDSKLDALLKEHKKLLNLHGDLSRDGQKRNKASLLKLDKEIAKLKI